jgi:hypothetical protein
LKEGVELCSNEIIVKMDSDDIMNIDRIQKQLEFMKKTPDCVIVGSNIQMFYVDQNNTKVYKESTYHPLKLTWDEYKSKKSHWIMNHPTVCYKKSAVLSVGNYNVEMGSMAEDLDLELRLLKRYGVIYNISENLLQYRIHSEQATYQGKASTSEQNQKKNNFINSLIYS